MLTKEQKNRAMKRIQELKKNPPKVLPEHHKQAKDLLEKTQAFEASKDRSIENERKALAKDVGNWTYNQMFGVDRLFNGFGEGKKNKCMLCGEHDSQMHNMNDGQWYCTEHRWFGNLTKEKQERERLCLSQKKD